MTAFIASLPKYRKFLIAALAAATFVVINHGWGDSVYWADIVAILAALGVRQVPNGK